MQHFSNVAASSISSAMLCWSCTRNVAGWIVLLGYSVRLMRKTTYHGIRCSPVMCKTVYMLRLLSFSMKCFNIVFSLIMPLL
uniref:Uncharacterized protein n=1 Tax=Arundo donax TaxID=35708 RepID=A0A0A9GC81_ARUDO